MRHSSATVTWELTYGETTPYEWCIYVNGIPKKRFITRHGVLCYLEKITTEYSNYE